MENYNLLSVLTGLSIISSGCLIAFYFQKNLFSKYRNKVRNVMDKENPDNLG